MYIRLSRLASVALAVVVLSFASSSQLPAQIEYQTYSVLSKARVHTRVEGDPRERTASQQLTFGAPLPPERFNFNGPTVEAPSQPPQNPDPTLLNAAGTIFPQHVEMRPEFFDWGNDFFIRALNRLSEQARAQAQFETTMAMTFTVATAQEYSISASATSAPLDALSAVGSAFAYDFRLFRGPMPLELSSRSAPPFGVERTLLLEPGFTYRLEFDTLSLVNITGFGADGGPVETGLRGNVSLLIRPVPEPTCAAALGAGSVLLAWRRRQPRINCIG